MSRFFNKLLATSEAAPRRGLAIFAALLGLIITLSAVNISIAKYESQLANGRVVLLKLAPVDPRSLMQGDYMVLNYQLEDDIAEALSQSVKKTATDEDIEGDLANDTWFRPNLPEQFWHYNGFVILQLDKHHVGHFTRLADNSDKTTNNEIALRYKIRDGSIYIATNAFFFQEGHAKAFENAKFGLFRVNDKGAPLLQSMVNEDFAVIAPEK
ncbi:GDYXXLXY domain-containing protein [Psychrobacter ciconiae]|uniref:GDYXXLXY domain-containing protein n=1 Tax=Psychrobacter ciconiae TaxID=1553449 RepID=UPI00191B7B50|nr:GDYXXLXY domain-containing protein [Psychrobacter ciconiae]